jgi:hypothetical protein
MDANVERLLSLRRKGKGGVVIGATCLRFGVRHLLVDEFYGEPCGHRIHRQPFLEP